MLWIKLRKNTISYVENGEKIILSLLHYLNILLLSYINLYTTLRVRRSKKKGGKMILFVMLAVPYVSLAVKLIGRAI